MNNLILFTNSFLSYLLVLVIIVILAAVAIMIGIKMRKNKDIKTAALEVAEAAKTTKEE